MPTIAKKVLPYVTVFSLMLIGLFLFVPETFAALIQPTDVPKNISDATGGTTSFRQLALNIVDFFLFFLGLIATIMIIFGGVTYVTAAGNEEKIGSAKKIILYAIVGIIIILLSFAVVHTVISGAGTGTEVT